MITNGGTELRPELVRAIRSGAIVPLGSHRLVIGGAVVDAEIYRVGDRIHGEVDCRRQTMTLGNMSATVDGIFHFETDEETFQEGRRLAARVRSSPKLMALYEFVTSNRPLLGR